MAHTDKILYSIGSSAACVCGVMRRMLSYRVGGVQGEVALSCADVLTIDKPQALAPYEDRLDADPSGALHFSRVNALLLPSSMFQLVLPLRTRLHS
jgi:hypothetical protein